MPDAAIRIPKTYRLLNFYKRRMDCHNQSADWFRNDMDFRQAFNKRIPSGETGGGVCHTVSSVIWGSCTRPATSDTGRENTMPWAFFCMPICL